jgi:uncharacterized membrane protein YdbT with pleckstrin-like domain
MIVKYVRGTLTPGEEILAIGKFHWTYTLVSWMWLILLGWAIVGIVAFAERTIRKNSTELAVTTERFVFKRGWIARRTDEFSTNRIQHVRLEQSYWGRLLGYGKIIVHSADVGRFGLPEIAKPLEFRKALIDSAQTAPRADDPPEK